MSLLEQQQQQFIACVKGLQTPEQVGIEARRMAIYQDLFFNNVKGFVDDSFPVLASLYDENIWSALVRAFFVEHDCISPYFVDISKEFVDYLSHQRQPQDTDFPFMRELAHYEWVELDVSVRHESQPYDWLDVGGLNDDTPLVLSQTAWPLSYRFAVHQISAAAIPTEPHPGGVHLIVYRDEEDEVQFMQINAVTGLLVQLLTDNPGVTLGLLVRTLVDSLIQFDPGQISAGAVDMVQNLAGKGVIRHFA